MNKNNDKKNYGNKINIYNIKETNIPEKYLELVNVKWPRPSVISNSILMNVELNKFYYTEKIDGINKHLLIFDKKVYDVSNFEDLKLMDSKNFISMNFTDDCILETEFYNNCYYIFDVYYLKGKNYKDSFIDERIESIKKYLNDLGPSFKIKKYYEIPNIDFLLEYIKKDKSNEGIDIDGVILQRKDKPYFQEGWKEFNVYKLKPIHLNTIDFLVKFDDKKNLFNLYLKGNYYYDYYCNFKKIPRKNAIFKINNINKPLDGNQSYKFYKNEKVLIFFDSPFYPDLGIMKINKNWNKNNYSQKAIKQIDDLINKIIENPSEFNNIILELSLTEDKKWVPLKIREDKTLPNTYKVGQNNISIIFDQIKPLESIYFQKNLVTSEEDLDIIHKINQTFRQYIIEYYINPYGKYSSIIDLCGGRGADEFNLFSNGVSNFFVIDSDTTALRKYFMRTNSIKDEEEYKPLIENHYYHLQFGRDYLSLNILNYTLDKDYQQIENDLYSRYEFNKYKKIDIVLMNYAIHYLCEEKEKLIKLCEFVYKVLNSKGIFIITYFDGDEILKMEKNNYAKIGPFNIKIYEKGGNYIAKMPMPTIKSGEDFYVEEPLVQKERIKILEDYFYLGDEYFIYERSKYYINKINNVDKYIMYYKLIKVGIYYKK